MYRVGMDQYTPVGGTEDWPHSCKYISTIYTWMQMLNSSLHAHGYIMSDYFPLVIFIHIYCLFNLLHFSLFKLLKCFLLFVLQLQFLLLFEISFILYKFFKFIQLKERDRKLGQIRIKLLNSIHIIGSRINCIIPGR